MRFLAVFAYAQGVAQAASILGPIFVALFVNLV